jgi:hypothetical protein
MYEHLRRRKLNGWHWNLQSARAARGCISGLAMAPVIAQLNSFSMSAETQRRRHGHSARCVQCRLQLLQQLPRQPKRE